jgi:3-phenylpropionate/cinnamic acid dioxygenase small subunit
MAATTPTPVPAEDAAAILDVLALYAQVVDNRAWDHVGDVFTADASIGGAGPADFGARVEGIEPYHPHYTTDTVLHAREDGAVRAWSKYVIVRTDGSIASGDYLDTFVRTSDGWRIAEREISRGSRPASDPGGASERTLTVAGWLNG